MWSDILGLALFVSLNPLLLGFILLVLSRPRPVPNLVVFWVGCLIVNVPGFLIPLFVLRAVPSFAEFAEDLTTADPSSGIEPFQLGTGIFALAVSAVIALRMWVKRRANQPVLVGSGAGDRGPTDDASTLVLDSGAREAREPGAIARMILRMRSALQRLVSRLHQEWENGALWVALVFGLAYIPPPPLVLLVDTIIGGSGAPIGTQIIAVFVFIMAMLAVFEITLLSYVIAPRRTQAVLEPLHEWSHRHRQMILLVLFGAVGIWELIVGLGVI
ncbi:peptidoglycolipid exporter Gap [Mycolicibacterium smegmatis]|uniref:Peptidoglycolipid exporter Gap n=2 Tax=Mycolicibacterium smegmatis TaxID=1772 RepID=GAP_MYCS2|nr:GAP family protein [Mycolicibacterium smegmatis]Q3L890.1 RecName: Full=Peptidoglycolipid exporter Gap; AltName: Full=GPLs addressing protein [Mycolicibacterium smegmatis MC2 155]AAT01808.1 integral membrane protein [Mycolicibacterium smegmatis MC2 155]ABK71066.1 integral membrane protein [Mycolicibacterium smegmatis MC2 155]AFP36874.1 integral membrane protein [Mycolicibacterium smegmatis MC2 155]AIU05677.1 integral membrane protein [Mycolicibacterium smegmatis MC2 155]AIU12302.1 integral 